MKKPLLLVLLTCFCLFSYGQTDVRSRGSGTGTDQPAQPQQGQKRYSGRILDQDGQPVVGATISVIDATGKTVAGTYTDADGNYSVSAAPGLKLKVSSVSYTATETVLGDSETLNYTLQESNTLMEEVVVTGYGSQKRGEVTGSIATIKGAEINNLVASTFASNFGGRVAGVQISTASGNLGEATPVRIRGINSITGSSEPLYVVDGMPLFNNNLGFQQFNNPLAYLNPQDIESVEFIKDAGAGAIYGSRATNGVVQITTKKGKAGQATVTYDFNYGYSETLRRLKILDGDNYIALKNEGVINSGQPALFFNSFIANGAGGAPDRTDWQKEVYRRHAPVMNNTLTISGGNEKITYNLSIGYSDQFGLVVNNRQNRYTGRMSVQAKVNDFTSAGIDLSLSRFDIFGQNSAPNGGQAAALTANLLPPNVAVYNPAGVLGYNLLTNYRVGNGGNGQVTTLGHPLAVLNNNVENSVNYRTVGNMYLDFKILPVPGLSFRTAVGIDYYYLFARQLWDARVDAVGGPRGGLTQNQYNRAESWQWQNYFTYDRSFGAHNVNAVLGVEYLRRETNFLYAVGQGFLDQAVFQYLSSTTTPLAPAGVPTNYGLDAYFGRVNYSYQNKYYATVALRNDGISRFAKDSRRGTFYSVSAGWTISEEAFFKNTSALSFVNNLKLRASYGTSGNSEVGAVFAQANFPYASVFGSVNYGDFAALDFTQAGDSRLKWETSNKLDIGLDLTAWNNRINFTFDYFNNLVENLILASPQAPSLGIPGNSVTSNLGRLTNSGFEFSLRSTNVNVSGFKWETSFNLTTINNRVGSLNLNGDDLIFGQNIVRVGNNQTSYFLIQWAGVNPADGDPRFYDINGNIREYNQDANNWTDQNGAPAAAISTNDRVVGPPSAPTWYGGITNTFSYKGIELSILLQYAGGYYIYNATYQGLMNFGTSANNLHFDALSRWTPGNPDASVPRYRFGRIDGNQTSTRFLERGDHIRIRQLTLAYSFPGKILQKLGLKKLTVYGQAQNLFLFSNYKGIDPEVNANINNNAIGGAANPNSNFSLDQNGIPTPRIYTAGVTLSF